MTLLIQARVRRGQILPLVQMAIVPLTALVCGWIARRLGQARVFGEIVGGILALRNSRGGEAPNPSVP